MTERAPGDDTRAQDREDVPLDSLQRRPAGVRARPSRQPCPPGGIARRDRRPLVRCQPDGGGDRAARRRPGRAAGRGRAEGTQPVGVRADPLLPPQDGGDQPLRADRDLLRRALRRPRRALRVRRARPLQHHLAADADGQAPLRHRPARPRLSQPRHLRPPHVALGGVLRRLPLDDDRDHDRRARRLLRRRDRQPADALHRPDPDAARSRRAPHGGRVLRHRRSAQGRRHPRAPLLDGDRPDRPRRLPLAPREGVRRGGEGERRQRHAGSSCVTCSRTRSGRSSSTRR